MNKITLTFNMNLDHYKLLITTRTQSLRWEVFESTKPSCAAQVSYLKPHSVIVLSTPVACHIKLSFVGQLQVILKFSNIIVKLGGLHLEVNMLRSFVSLNWKIDYLYLVKSIGFKSPKSQI